MTLDLTTLPLTAPIRLLPLGDVTPVYPMTVQFTRCDIGALESWLTVGAGSYFHSASPIMDRFDGKLPCVTVVVVFSELDGGIQNLSSEKGILPHKVFKVLLLIPPLYNFWGGIFFLTIGDDLLVVLTMFLVAVFGQRTRKEVCDIFFELDGSWTY